MTQETRKPPETTESQHDLDVIKIGEQDITKENIRTWKSRAQVIIDNLITLEANDLGIKPTKERLIEWILSNFIKQNGEYYSAERIDQIKQYATITGWQNPLLQKNCT